MSDIFLSYSRQDRERAETLAKALESQGWSVWWDPVIPAGRTFDKMIEEELDTARCVVVLWSKRSVDSDWVRTEAAEGKERGILVPVLIDDVKIPLAFRRIQAADLVGWDGAEVPALTSLMGDILRVLGQPPRGTAPSQASAVAKPQRKAGQQFEASRRAEAQRQAETRRQRKVRAERRFEGVVALAVLILFFVLAVILGTCALPTGA